MGGAAIGWRYCRCALLRSDMEAQLQTDYCCVGGTMTSRTQTVFRSVSTTRIMPPMTAPTSSKEVAAGQPGRPQAFGARRLDEPIVYRPFSTKIKPRPPPP